MSVVPFGEAQTVNTTQHIPHVKPKDVWPVVKAMDEWDTFQDLFSVVLVDGNKNKHVVAEANNRYKGDSEENSESGPIVEVGQQIEITSDFPVIPQVTLEEYDEIVEEERICWTLRGFIFGEVTIPSPPCILRTARCIELFKDGEGGTIIHNWISYEGLGWPVVVATTGKITENLFSDFNQELANQF